MTAGVGPNTAPGGETDNEEYGWSVEVQRKGLALCILDPTAYGTLGPQVFAARYISHPTLRIVAEVLYRACDGGGGVPPSTEMLTQLVEERAGRERPAVADAIRRECALVLAVRLSDAQLVRSRMVEWAREAAVRLAVLQAATIAEQKTLHNGGGAEMIHLLQDALAIGREGQMLRFVGNPGAILALLQEQEHQIRIPTGIAQLDRALGGGAEPGLHMLAGLPKIGKTAFLTMVTAGAAATSKTVFQVSGEVGYYSMARRMISAMTGRSRDEIADDPGQAVHLAATAYRFAHGEIIVEYQPGFTVDWLAARMRQLEAQGTHVDVIVADFIDLMRGGTNGATRTERRHELEDIGRALRDLGMELGVPVWTAKALNRRAVEKIVPTDADLAECFGLVYIVDNLFVLCGTKEELDRRIASRSAPIVRLFYADARERECRYTIGAFERDNDRHRWVYIPGYHHRRAAAAPTPITPSAPPTGETL